MMPAYDITKLMLTAYGPIAYCVPSTPLEYCVPKMDVTLSRVITYNYRVNQLYFVELTTIPVRTKPLTVIHNLSL